MKMSDVTAAAAAASAATAGASVVGLPPQAVIVCAVAGAIVGVWVSHAKDAEMTWRWALGSLGLVAGYAGFAVLAATAGTAVFPQYEITKPLASIPAWVISGGLAMSGFWVLPVLADWLKGRAK
jgi:hypothetical protein